LNDLRNRVAHADRVLVEKYEDVKRLVDALELLATLDGDVQRSQQRAGG
jgi:hypothetical protein